MCTKEMEQFLFEKQCFRNVCRSFYKHFISTSTGAQDAKGNDVLLLDAGKLPRRENFTYKKDFDNEARNLIS